MKTHSTPLTAVPAGKKVRIVSLAGGRGMCARLTSMGLVPGSEIEIVKSGDPGPFIVTAGNCRLAIGTGMAAKIMVRSR
ncbi:MAG: ferrous iron transport protein A [Deltaproteobacteria bacterium]|nr:ferrous iron transport protein A [Deltaproteobacteria bacterium]MBW2596181.1 ferrous iron transport protein A [Deltaproteobacteria bacterium]